MVVFYAHHRIRTEMALTLGNSDIKKRKIITKDVHIHVVVACWMKTYCLRGLLLYVKIAQDEQQPCRH